MTSERRADHAGKRVGETSEGVAPLRVKADLEHPRPGHTGGETPATLRLRITELEQELGDEEHGRELHASLNLRAAEALGKPPFGKGSSWHDIPECITALRERIATLEKAGEMLAGMGDDMTDFMDHGSGCSYYGPFKTPAPSLGDRPCSCGRDIALQVWTKSLAEWRAALSGERPAPKESR